jgi:hypothetical protein
MQFAIRIEIEYDTPELFYQSDMVDGTKLAYENLPGSGDKQKFRRIRKINLDEFLDKNLSVSQRHKTDNKPEKKAFLTPKSA